MNRTVCVALVLVLFAIGAPARANVESNWGAREYFSQQGHLRYLLMLPPHYDPRQKYELFVSLHGSPGCAEHAMYLWRVEAQARNAIILAPQATDWTRAPYTCADGKRAYYAMWEMHEDRPKIWTVIDEVTAQYPIDKRRITLLGFSAGCELGWRLLADRPEEFCFFGGVANRFKNGRQPAFSAGLRRAARHVALFYAAGQADSFAGPGFRATARILRSYGFRMHTVYARGVGHALPWSIRTPLIAYMDEVRARLAKPFAAARVRPLRAPGVARREWLAAGVGFVVIAVAGYALMRRQGKPGAAQ